MKMGHGGEESGVGGHELQSKGPVGRFLNYFWNFFCNFFSENYTHFPNFAWNFRVFTDLQKPLHANQLRDIFG